MLERRRSFLLRRERLTYGDISAASATDEDDDDVTAAAAAAADNEDEEVDLTREPPNRALTDVVTFEGVGVDVVEPQVEPRSD